MTLAPPSAASTGTSRHNLMRAFRTSAAGALVRYAINLAIVPYVLHRVGSDLYGAWATMASILAVGALADAGVRTEIIRRVGSAQGEGDEEAIVRSVHQGVTLLVALAAAITVVGAIAAPAIRGFAFPRGVPGYGSTDLDMLIRAVVAVLAVSLVANGYFGVLRGIQRGDVESTGLLLSVPASTVVTVAALSLGWGLWALWFGSVAGVAVSVIWNAAGARRLIPGLRPRLVALRGPVAKGYLALSSLALLSQIGDVVDSQWDKVVLSRYVGSTAVTSFQIGTNLVLQGRMLALLPLAGLMVAIAELRRRDPARMEALFGLLARSGMVLAAVVMSGIFVFAPAFVRLWLDNDPSVEAAGHAARLFTVAVALNLVAAPMAFRAFGEGWHRLAAVGAGINMAVNATLSLLLTVAIGFDGALYGSISGNLVGTVVFLYLMRRRLGDRWTPPPCKALAIGCLAAGLTIMIGVDRADAWLPLGLAVVVYALLVTSACAAVERLPLRALRGLPE